MSQLPKKAFSLSMVWVVAIEVLILAGAIVIHMLSALPLEYSWSRTLELFWQSVTDKYFIVMACIALIAAAGVRARRSFSSPLRFDARFFISLALAAIVLMVMVAASSQYGAWDYAFLLPVLALMVPALRQRHPLKALAGFIATILVLVVTSYVFTIYKSQLFIERAPLDALLVEAESFLFGRPLYLSIAEWASTHTAWVRFSDWVYYLFFHHMALTALFLFACDDNEEQWRYVLSLALCYTLGGLSYFLFPAMGPVYFDPGQFSYLSANAEFTTFIQGLLKESTDGAGNGRLTVIETFAFIACMPSLHMAHETVMLFYSRRSRLMIGFAALFWTGAFAAVLILGWHYLFDVLGGLLLAALVIWIAQGIHLPGIREQRPQA